jgi:hypothetical protein
MVSWDLLWIDFGFEIVNLQILHKKWPKHFQEINWAQKWHNFSLKVIKKSSIFVPLKVVTNEKGEAVGEVATIIC